MKKDISANLYQKCLIFCSKIFLNVLHNLILTVLLPWQHTGFKTSPIVKAFLATFGVPFSYLQLVPIYMIQQAYKYVTLSLWPCLTSLTCTYWNQVDGDWKRVSCHGNKMFHGRRCVFCRTFSLTSINSLHCELAKIALFIYMVLFWVEYMMSSVISLAYFSHFSNLNISGTNAGICKGWTAFSFFHGILCDSPKFKFKFKFIYSHLFTYDIAKMRDRKEVKKQSWLYIKLNITKEKVCSSQRSRAFELAATTEQL